VLSGLKEAELKSMAEASLRNEGPGIPSLGVGEGPRELTSDYIKDFQKFLDSAGVKHIKPEQFLVIGASNTDALPDSARNSYPPRSLWPNIQKTAQVLDRLVEIIGSPIEIKSAYRTPGYNAGVGGASSTRHLQFNAVDFAFPGKGTPSEWAQALRKIRDEGMFKGGIGTYQAQGFVHIDTGEDNRDWSG